MKRGFGNQGYEDTVLGDELDADYADRFQDERRMHERTQLREVINGNRKSKRLMARLRGAGIKVVA